jgi:chemotaxis protein MotB
MTVIPEEPAKKSPVIHDADSPTKERGCAELAASDQVESKPRQAQQEEADDDHEEDQAEDEAGHAPVSSATHSSVVSVFAVAPPPRESDDWTLSFLDLMLLLLTFFVVLITTQLQLSKDQENAGPSWLSSLVDLPLESSRNAMMQAHDTAAMRLFEQRLAAQGLNGLRPSVQTPGYASVSIQGQFLFPSGSASLSERGQRMVAALASVLNNYQGEIIVTGHSDDQPIATPQYPSNWELSGARAASVVRHLLQHGVTPGRLRAVGQASTAPVASNATQLGRRENRRVEIQVRIEP